MPRLPDPLRFSSGHRVPPQDVEAERAVLGSILIDNDSVYIAIEELSTEDFYRPAHGLIFEAMVDLTTRSEPVDAITLTAALGAKDNLEKVGGLSAVVALSESVPTAANMKYYASLVSRKSMLRKLIAAGNIDC